MYFSATIFSLVGFRSPILASLVVAGTNFLFTLLAMGLIDRVGRRRILPFSIPVMIVGFALIAISFNRLPLSNNHIAGGFLASTVSDNQAAIPILLSMIIYVGSFAIGL